MATSFAFLPNFQDSTDPRMIPIVGVGWTITYEMLFYSLFALSLLMPRRVGPLACVGAIAGMVAAGTIGQHMVHHDLARRVIAFYSYKNMLFFAVGILLAMSVRILPGAAGRLGLPLQLAIMLSALGAYQLFHLRDGGLVRESISFLTCTIVAALAVAGPRTERKPLRRLLLHIGNASFSTYLFHAPLMHGLAIISSALLLRGGGVAFILCAGTICLAMGSLVHLGIELPLTRMIREGSPRLRTA